MTEALATRQSAELSSAIEMVMIQGDLSKLNPQQRVEYYKTVCESVGLNPYTRPFDYIELNKKLTLYARKDATDQLRKIHGVNIDDIHTDDNNDWFIVTVKGSDKTGRKDVEVGAVKKTDMNGNFGNALMKAVTKAKRRLTLSLCGLGWLDETEVESIPETQAQPVVVDDNGVIVGEIEARADSKPIVSQTPKNDAPKSEKPAEAQEKAQFDEVAFLRNWKHRSGLPSMTLEEACQVTGKDKKEYGTKTVEALFYMLNAIEKKMGTLTSPDAKETYLYKLSAINEILTSRASAQKQLDAIPDPFVKGAGDVQNEL